MEYHKNRHRSHSHSEVMFARQTSQSSGQPSDQYPDNVYSTDEDSDSLHPLEPYSYQQSSPRRKRSQSWTITADQNVPRVGHSRQQLRRSSYSSRSAVNNTQCYEYDHYPINMATYTSTSGRKQQTSQRTPRHPPIAPNPSNDRYRDDSAISTGYISTNSESFFEKASRWIGIHSFLYSNKSQQQWSARQQFSQSSRGGYQHVPQHESNQDNHRNGSAHIEMKSFHTEPSENEDNQTLNEPVYPRMIDHGRIFVRKRIKKKDWYALYGFDWFHSLIDAPTSRIILILMSLYLGIVLIFAIIYYQIHSLYFCDLDFNTFVGAFDFTLETMATIGYGTKNIYFDDCLSVSITLAVQMCIRLILDAFVIGVIYCRLARPNARASTVIFSNKAIIRRIRGKLYFMFQLCELRKHQLVEAHVRLYLVKREVDESVMERNEDYSRRSAYQTEAAAASSGKRRPQRKSPQYQDSGSIALDPNIGSRTEYPFQHYDHHRDYHDLTDEDYVMTNPSDSGGPGRRKHRTSSGLFAVDERNHHNGIATHPDANQRNFAHGHRTSQRRSRKLDDVEHYTYLQTCSMRLNHPNDELGAMLLLMVPQVVVHELDATSPLMPPPMWISANTKEVVRWNPPTYRPFEAHRPPPSKYKRNPLHRQSPKFPTMASSLGTENHHRVSPGARIGKGDRDGITHYNMNALSNLSFPNVIRRSSDFVKSDQIPVPVSTQATTTAGPSTSHSMSGSNSGSMDANHTQQQLKVSSNLSKSRDEDRSAEQSNAEGIILTQVPSHDSISSERRDVSLTPVIMIEDVAQRGSSRDQTPNRSAMKSRHSMNHQSDSGSRPHGQGEGLISPGLQKFEHHITGIDGNREGPWSHESSSAKRSSDDIHSKNLCPSDHYYQFGHGSTTPPQSSFTPNRSTNATVMNPTSSQPPIETGDFGFETDDGEDTNPYLHQNRSRYYRNNGNDHENDYEGEPAWQREEKEMIQRYMLDRQIEIVAIVEGSDPATGGSVQARHSYVVNEIEWDKRFQHCVYQDPDDFYATVDFDLFHELTEAPKDAAYPGPVPSSI